jgi:superfamily II DNA/RNA helicase
LHGETKRKQASAGLLIIGLQQRLLSSIEAFARTLRVHKRTVQRQWEAGEKDRTLAALNPSLFELLATPVGSDDDRANLSEAELEAEEDAQIEAATLAGTGTLAKASSQDLFAREQKLLEEMTRIAENARSQPDARVRRLFTWIRQQMCPDLGKPGAKWNALRILIFTEYEDTKRYLHNQLSQAIEGSDRAEERIAIYHGPTSPDEREAIKHAFNADPGKHPVRILIATDAAREGLNLQAHCWNLFHFDVPWNPSRMEQRNGRIDRKLQPKPEVFCHYFVYKQRPEDRILVALIRKSETIMKELGSLAQVVDSRLASSLRHGIRRDAIDSLESEIASADIDRTNRGTVEEELEASRERQDALRAQIDRLRNLLEKSQKSIGLAEEPFKSALSCALELIGAEPLKAPLMSAHDGPPRIAFPALDQRQGADPTWAETMDSLREPRPKDQKFWEWRRQSPIRPVVFEDSGFLDDEVVHLHLEHRVVQRLLGRFIAQGFVHHDLSRACLAQTTDAVPRVILLGRLSLYGPGAARLHEELIPVTARWTDPKIRKGSLAPYAREAETKTMQLLEDALAKGSFKSLPAAIQKQLQASAPKDVQDLLPFLQTRGEEYAVDAIKLLAARADAEAKAMREILETQKKHIGKTVKDHKQMEMPLFAMGDDESEIRQYEANKRYWDKRLISLEKELNSEPERIREIYQVKAKRIEPVGLVFLWPVTG